MNNENKIDEAAWEELNKQSRELEIEELQKVTREEDKRAFADAQHRIGLFFFDEGNYIDAIATWMNIKKSDDSVIYARAQFNTGFCLNELEKTNEALNVWNNVKREDNASSYARARLNTGVVLAKNNNLAKAVSAWIKIKRSDNIEVYLQAQLNLGRALKKLDKIDEAVNTWNSITHSDNSEIYAEAQLNIGMTLYTNNDIKGALLAWNNIKREDNADTYTNAQFNIGLASDRIENALLAWRNIKHTDDFRTYSKAQFYIGKNLIIINSSDFRRKEEKNKIKIKDIKEAIISFKESEILYPYESYCYIQICELLLSKKSYLFGKKLQKFFEEIIIITKNLTLDFSNNGSVDTLPERKLAHYTSTETTNLLINSESKNKIPSSFRLNTINNVNDPSEGKLLESYLTFGREKNLYLPDFDEKFHTFISCFTFNHDSLNQFRLYGKKDNLEASGISLVFRRDFFQPKNFFDGVSFLSALERESNIDNSYRRLQSIEIEAINENINPKDKVEKKPVMRCIYIEPISGYIQIAQRNRLTFYREFKVEEEAEKRWKQYKFEIDNKTKEISSSLNILKDVCKDIKKNNATDFKNNTDLIEEILLPLKYLIKHSAFQEEQECRMIYITSLEDHKVKIDFGRFLYVEYEADVRSNLDKIYIAPAATQYQPYLAKLLCDTNVKIELSNNPYRQT